MKKIAMPMRLISQIKFQYNLLPIDGLEYGGVICGKKKNVDLIATKFEWISSLIPSQDSFAFDNNILMYPKVHCDNDDIIAIFHTHSADAPYPSQDDRDISKKLNTVGCIIAPSSYINDKNDDPYLQCFIGNTNVDIRISTII